MWHMCVFSAVVGQPIDISHTSRGVRQYPADLCSALNTANSRRVSVSGIKASFIRQAITPLALVGQDRPGNSTFGFCADGGIGGIGRVGGSTGLTPPAMLIFELMPPVVGGGGAGGTVGFGGSTVAVRM